MRDVLAVRAVRISAVDISTGRWRHGISGVPQTQDVFASRSDFGAPGSNPRVAHALTAPLHRIWTDDDLAPHDERRTWDIYRDLWEPNGCEHGWSVVLHRTGDTVVLLTAADARRSARRTDVPDLLSHFVADAARSIDVERKLRLREAAAVARAMAALNTGCVPLDGFARVLGMNEQAREYMVHGGPLRIGGAHLYAADPGLDVHLQKLLGHATRPIEPVGSEVALPGDGGKFTIAPLGSAADDLLGLGAVAVVAINPMRPRNGHSDEKAAAYGLSAAERAILPAFINGASVDEIAAQRGTTRETIRSQLKSIYSKAGVNSRAELMVAFLGGGGPNGGK